MCKGLNVHNNGSPLDIMRQVTSHLYDVTLPYHYPSDIMDVVSPVYMGSEYLLQVKKAMTLKISICNYVLMTQV